MTNGPRQLRKKQSSTKTPINRYISIALIVVAVGAGIYLVAGGRSGAETETVSHTPIDKSLGRLYDEAQEDLEKDNLQQAASKFKQVANIKPGYKDADAQAEAIAASYYKEGMDMMDAGDLEEAADAFNIAAAIDPTNPDITAAVEDAAEKIEDEGSGGDDDTTDSGDSTDPVDNGDNSGEDAKPIPEGATALSLHLAEIDGYLSIKKAWNSKPIEASSVYLPTAREMRTEIDRVIVIISEYPTDNDAEDALQAEKEEYKMEGEDDSINDHSAYLGLNDFSASEIFKLKQIAVLTWTRDNWFFSVQVLPSPQGTPSNEYKKGITRDIAVKLGY